MWIILLGMLAATLPIAALNDGSSGTADASPAPAAPERRAPEKTPTAPPPPIETRIEWRRSIAHGTATAGWLERGVILPEEGPGFYTYDPRGQTRPNAAVRRYGTAMLVRELIDLGAWWAREHPGAPRLGVGDLAHEGGGRFELHVSHQNGLDVDIRMPRSDGAEGRVGPGTYDRALTQELADHLVARGVEYVFYGPNLTVRGPAGVVEVWPNHDDHLHVRFRDPDGAGN